MSFKLLLADDSLTIQRVVELTFADEDIRVVAVGDGEQAIERLQQERPDIVLADISMPRRDGYEVAAFVGGQPSLAGVPVLLLAGAFEPVDEQRVREVGARGVLVKPFEPQLVIRRVRELLGLSLEASSPSPPTSRRDDEAGRSGAANEAALDDYFHRLDAAFATLETRGNDPRSAPPSSPRVEAPKPAAVPPSASAEPTGVDRGAGFSNLTKVFAALLAAEQGEPVSTPLPAAVPEAVIDRIVERVLARLSDRVVREVVADLVSDTAERLVREEIERLRKGDA